jgi:anti-sigma regulatory factor (Ser/Thr protein kinase)
MSLYEFSFVGLPEQVSEARELLAKFLTGTGVPAPAVDNAVLASGELMANAVMYSASGMPGGKVTLHSEVGPAWLKVDVLDQGRIPTGGERSLHQTATRPGEGGLGLFMVAALTTENGTFETADGQHSVWFRITWTSIPSQGVIA